MAWRGPRSVGPCSHRGAAVPRRPERQRRRSQRVLDQGAPPHHHTQTAPPSPGPGARLMRRKPVEHLVAEGGQGDRDASRSKSGRLACYQTAGRKHLSPCTRPTREVRARKVFQSCRCACQTATPNSYRLIKRPITTSCMRSVLEKQIVRRTNRLIRVRKLMCLLSIFWVLAFPTVCCSAST